MLLRVRTVKTTGKRVSQYRNRVPEEYLGRAGGHALWKSQAPKKTATADCFSVSHEGLIFLVRLDWIRWFVQGWQECFCNQCQGWNKLAHRYTEMN